MTYPGYSRADSSGAGSREPANIIDVDTVNRKCTAVTRSRYTITVNTAYAVGDSIVTPAKGEQWYVERFDMEWRLAGRLPHNDSTLNIEAEEGQVSVGSASGPLELNGTEIRSNGPFRLGITYFSTSASGKLQYSLDGTSWAPVSGAGGGGGGIDSTDDIAEGSKNKYYTAARVASDAPVKSVAGKGGEVSLTKVDVGLNNVDNTADNAKPVSTATANALSTKADLINSLVPTNQLPPPVVREYANVAAFPSPGNSGVIYIAKDTALLYRWDGTAFTLAGGSGSGGGGISNTDSLPEGLTNKYFTDARLQSKINSLYGSAANTITQGNDARLSNERTPTNGSVTLAKTSAEVAVSLGKADTALQSITDGSLGLAKLSATGLRNASTVLRGDNTWGSVGSVTSGASMSRTLTANVGVAATTAVLTNYFNVDNDHTADITSDPANSKFVVTIPGIYLAQVQYKRNPAGNTFSTFTPVIFKNGLVYRWGVPTMANDSNGYVMLNSYYAEWIVPLAAGDVIQAGYNSAPAANTLLNGDANGQQAWFALALLSSG